MSWCLEPLFPYAGGKRQSLGHISPYLRHTQTYVEPFFGGGAVYCHMVNLRLAKNFIINDIHQKIIGVYKAIRNDPEAFYSEYSDLLARYRSLCIGGKSIMFADQQDAINIKYNAASYLFIRTSNFGGILKSDAHGNDISPSGHMRAPNRSPKVDRDKIILWSKALCKTEIQCGDFERLNMSVDNAIVFCDPPYIATKIVYNRFTNGDQVRCLNWCKRLSDNKSICVLLSNRDHGRFFSKRICGNVDCISYEKAYSAGENVRNKEAQIIWNRK